jgi:hypothetical protein
MTGGIDIILPHRKSGQTLFAYGYLNRRVLEGGGSLLPAERYFELIGFSCEKAATASVGRGSRIT